MEELHLYLDALEYPKQEPNKKDTTEQRGCEEVDFTLSDDNVTDNICN
jgi:hypothetical protein